VFVDGLVPAGVVPDVVNDSVDADVLKVLLPWYKLVSVSLTASLWFPTKKSGRN
jgi:hypothetical protein